MTTRWLVPPRARVVFAAFLAVAMVGCGSAGGPPLRGLGPEDLYQRGVSEFEGERWSAAIEAFERLVLEYPTHPRIQEVRYRIGQAYMGRGEYVTAAAEFLRLVTEFPASELADDARFQACQSYAELSPDIQLDQEYTHAAIDHCQALISYHPDSPHIPEARATMDAMRNKLARKVLTNGEYYLRRNALDSAILYFEEVVDRYPASGATPRALLRLVEAYRRVGYVEEMEQARDRLLREFPDSPEAGELRSVSVASGR